MPVINQSLKNIPMVGHHDSLSDLISRGKCNRRRNCAEITINLGDWNLMGIMMPYGIKIVLYIIIDLDLEALFIYCQNGVVLVMPELSDAWLWVAFEIHVDGFQ